MFCKNCGEEIKDNAKFCGKCGAVVRDDVENSSETAAEYMQEVTVNKQNAAETASENNQKAAVLVNESKNLVLRFFTKNPSAVIKEAAHSKSYVGFVLIAISALLFAFVSCFNIPQAGVSVLNSLMSSLQGMASSIAGSSLGGLVAGAFPPNLSASPLFNLFLPLLAVGIIMPAVQLAGMFIALKIKHKKMNHYTNAINVIGIATLPVSAVLILNFVLGFILPVSVPFIFAAAVFVNMVLIFEGLRHIINDGNAPILAFSVIAAVICIVVLIICCIAVNSIIGSIQNSVTNAVGGAVSDGLKGLFS